jgi:hypothetical protein
MINPATTFAISRFLRVNFDRGVKFHQKLFFGKISFSKRRDQIDLVAGQVVVVEKSERAVATKAKKKIQKNFCKDSF